MAKGNILSDTFEQLAELGQTTAKQGAKQVGQTFSPLKLLDQLTGKTQGSISEVKGDSAEGGRGSSEVKGGKSTPLNLDKLHQKYQNQDKVKMESLRHHLFQLVKREDEKSLERKKAEKQEKEKQEEKEKQAKKKQQAQQQQVQQLEEEPHGKIRRSIFSPKKVAKRQTLEVRPSAGKQ